MIAGTGPEVLVAVEDIEDLYLHIGQLAGHDRWFALNCYIGEAFVGIAGRTGSGTGFPSFKGIAGFHKRSFLAGQYFGGVH